MNAEILWTEWILLLVLDFCQWKKPLCNINVRSAKLKGQNQCLRKQIYIIVSNYVPNQATGELSLAGWEE